MKYDNYIIKQISGSPGYVNIDIILSKDKSIAEHGEYISKRSRESDMLR